MNSAADPYAQLQSRLQYQFRHPALLRQAATHRSFSASHNERLEFLGDAVLNCTVTALLFQRFPNLNEGDLSRMRANLVKQQTLYEIAHVLGIAEHLRLGEGELKSGGRQRASILADMFEAMLGAVYLDGGFEAAQLIVERLFTPLLDPIEPARLGKDAKSLLQEYLQGRALALPQYTVAALRGAAHQRRFEVTCSIPALGVKTSGSDMSRRAAEQAAAKDALHAIRALRRPKNLLKNRSERVSGGGGPGLSNAGGTGVYIDIHEDSCYLPTPHHARAVGFATDSKPAGKSKRMTSRLQKNKQ